MRHIDLIVADIPDSTPVRIEDGRNGIVVIRIGDHLSAFEDSCPHAQWRLSEGEIVDGVLECPGHAWEFCSDTGRCLNVPAYRLIRIDAVQADGTARLFLEPDDGGNAAVTSKGMDDSAPA
jgi:nitrite reductase/ring-hydroxylating ferredoxin subunit